MMRGTVLLLAGLAGCGFVTSEFEGHKYGEKSGVLVVDGVPLPHKRWVQVDVPVGTGSLRLAAATADIVLSGSPDSSSHLEVQLYSEVENDGSAILDGGKIVVRSTAGRLVIMNGARGTLAHGMRLDLGSGTGDLSLEGLPELSDLQLDSGTGDVRLTQCTAGDVRITTGTGDVHLAGLEAGRVEVDSGTGEAHLATCALSSLEVTTGTADVHFSECRSSRTEVESGTGDVLLEGQNDLGTTQYDLGTGQVRSR
jgi:Putative adhesin